MRFRLTAIFYAMALIGASIAAFTVVGVVPAALILSFWASILLPPSPEKKRAEYLPVILACLTFGVFLLPSIGAVRPSAFRDYCGNQLRDIGVALRTYESDYGCLPPSCILDDRGHPMHSWRVLLLPYLGEKNIYEAYDFSEPWDGPNNRRVLTGLPTPDAYSCSLQYGNDKGETDYVAVVGPATALTTSKPRKSTEIIDGPSNTLVVAEARESGIHWMEPRDFPVDELHDNIVDPTKSPADSAHHLDKFLSWQSGWNGLFADGTAANFDATVSRETLQALATIDGGEAVSRDTALAVCHWKWGRVVGFGCFWILVAIPIVWLRKRNQELTVQSGGGNKDAAP